MRVETTAGLSPYSNEVLISTPAPAAISPPSGLRLVSANQIEATLAWANNAPGAMAIRLEVKNPGASGFVDLGPYPLTGTKVPGLSAQQTYTFRARAETAEGYSAYSNELMVTTPPKINVFLLHGIRQDWPAMASLSQTLTGSLTSGRFNIISNFSFFECSTDNCAGSCTISQGAIKLGQLVKGIPNGQIAFVGYSMGGLLARDLVANNWGGALTGRTVPALITLGTPNLGYPYASQLDYLAACDPIAAQMKGDFREVPNTVTLSPYLFGLHQTWAGRGFPGISSTWLAAAGQSCAENSRSSSPLSTPSGCSDTLPFNDRVVCSQSATYGVQTPVGTSPSTVWTDPERRYVHTEADHYKIFIGYATNLFCDFDKNPILDFPLHSPPPGGLLATRIVEVLNALP
jgi:pimeloyl-ACP methyl ester carboxylesterase